MEVDAVIADLFDLPDSPKPLQDKASCNLVIKHLSKFCNNSSSWFDEAEYAAFRTAIERLDKTKPGDKVDWLPEYGCALKKSTDGCITANEN